MAIKALFVAELVIVMGKAKRREIKSQALACGGKIGYSTIDVIYGIL